LEAKETILNFPNHCTASIGDSSNASVASEEIDDARREREIREFIETVTVVPKLPKIPDIRKRFRKIKISDRDIKPTADRNRIIYKHM